MVLQSLVVPQQQRRAVHLGQYHVEVAITVNVGERGAAAHDGLEQIAPTSFWRNADESAGICCAAIPEELGGLRVALALLDFANLFFQMAVGREQIEPAIKVVIK